MEDRTLNEKESLELITRMIQNSKKNMELGSGKYLPAVGIPLGSDGGRGAVAGVADGHHEVELAVVCHPFAGVAFAGVSGKKAGRPVLTYTDKVITAVWSVLGMAMGAGAVVYCTDADTSTFILPMMVLCAGIGVAITGAVICDRWMRFCGLLSFFIALFTLRSVGSFNLEDWYGDCVTFIVCIVLMFIIPGHRLNREARRMRKGGGE